MKRPTPPPQQHARALIAIAGDCSGGNLVALQPLFDQLEARYGDNLAALLYYGSCLRSGRVYDGLNDFYVIVDSYRRAHPNPFSAVANALIPPNVYYLECDGEHGRLRAKYAVLSMTQLERGARGWFNPGVWGRFAQPTAIARARSSAIRQRVQAAFGQCVVSLLNRALPALPEKLAVTTAFAGALALSYRSELRVESRTQGTRLIDTDAPEYRRRVIAAIPLLRFQARVNGETFSCDIGPLRRLGARLTWPLRSVQGKLLSVLRLAKACFTFTGAVDYGAWKLERHTGVKVEVSDRLRRYPLIFIWPLLWRLYRQGALK